MAKLMRSQFAQAPIELLESTTTRKGTLFVYLWLWHHAGTADSAWPSIATLARECGMKDEAVREAIGWLGAEGWIRRIARPGRTPVYKVRLERPDRDDEIEGCRPTTPPPNGGVHPSPKQGRGTPPPNGGGEQEPIEQEPSNKRTASTATPLKPPQGGGDRSAAAVPDPDPEQPGARKPARPRVNQAVRDPFAGKVVPPGALPAALLEVAELFARWWEVKPARSRTRAAFELACKRLLGMSPGDRQEALESAVMGGYQGIHAPKTGRGGGGYHRPPVGDRVREAVELIGRIEGRPEVTSTDSRKSFLAKFQ